MADFSYIQLYHDNLFSFKVQTCDNIYEKFDPKARHVAEHKYTRRYHLSWTATKT
jgi:hypothetical protein